MECDTHTVRSFIEQGSSFDSISRPSDNSRQKEEAFVPVGSPGYLFGKFLDPIPLPPRLYGDDFGFLKKTWTPVRGASIASLGGIILGLLRGRAPPKKLTLEEEEVEIRKSIVGAYRTIMKRKALTVSQLEDIWRRIKMLEEESRDIMLALYSGREYCQTVALLKTEFRGLLSFVAPNLRSTCQAPALMTEVDRGRGRDLKTCFLDLFREASDCMDLVRAPIFTGSVGEDFTSTIFDTENPTADDGFLISDAAIHPLHGNAAKTSKASFGFGSTMQTGKMKAESYKDPLLPQKNNQARELENLSNFAFLGLTMCYAILYFLYSAFLGNKGSNMRVMTGLHIWTAFLMLLLMLFLFVGSFIQFSVGTLKVMRLVMSGLLFVSSSLVFILLQLSL